MSTMPALFQSLMARIMQHPDVLRLDRERIDFGDRRADAGPVSRRAR